MILPKNFKKSIITHQRCIISLNKSFWGLNAKVSGNKRIKKIWYPSVTISILGYFDFEKMHVENTNEIHHVYNAMVVLHICNRILGISSPG